MRLLLRHVCAVIPPTKLALLFFLGGSRLFAQSDAPYRPGIHAVDYAVSIDLPDSGASTHGDATLTLRRTGSIGQCWVTRSY